MDKKETEKKLKGRKIIIIHGQLLVLTTTVTTTL